jgi:conserved domain protein
VNVMTTTDTYKTFESKKFLNGLGIIFLAAVLTAVGNMIQTNVKQGLEPLSFWQSFEGCMVLFGVATIGYFIANLPYCKKLSPVLWLGIIGVIMSSPIFPGNEWIVEKTKIIQFAALGTPTLAYAGLALGKDIPILKKLSWKIVIVSLAVFFGTFIFSAIVSQISLFFEGVIQ